MAECPAVHLFSNNSASDVETIKGKETYMSRDDFFLEVN